MATETEWSFTFVRAISPDRILVNFPDDVFRRGITATGTSDANIKFPVRLGEPKLYIFRRNLPVVFTVKSPDNREFTINIVESHYNDMEGQEHLITPIFPKAPPEPEFPKIITRGNYSFTATNPEEEKQLREFLGLFPPGDDLDTWLSKRDLAGLEQWKDYWFNIFGAMARQDLLTFISNKFEEYKIKIEIPPEEIPWYEKYLNITKEDLEAFRIYDVIGTIGLLGKMIEPFFPEELLEFKFALPTWIKELELWLFFAPLLTTTVEGLVKAGATSTEANKITTLLKDQNFLKALDTMKLNPLKYADDFAKLDPKIASQILKGMKKDQIANLAREVFSKAWSSKVAANAPFWTKVKLFLLPTEKATISNFIKWAGIIWGLDTLVNWGAVDNLGFLTVMPARQIEELYAEGTITQEEALNRIDKLLNVNKLGRDKLEVSKFINPFAILFYTIFKAISEGNREQILLIKESIEAIEPPKPTGTLIIRPTPSDAKVSVEGQIPSTGVYSAELPIGLYSWTVSKFGFISESGSIEIKEDVVSELNIQIFEVEEEIPPEEIPPEIPPEEVIGKLTINVEPEDALIEVAGQDEITIPGTYDLTPGSYSVRASKEGFISQIKTAYVSDKKDTVVSFILEVVEIPPELPTKATIQITSEPTNSDIYIDGAYTWTKTPYTTILDAGTYIIRVQQDGFFPQEASVTISEGDEIIVPFVLEEIPEPEKPVVEYLPQEPYYPTYQAPTYYKPAVQLTPYSQVSIPSYNLLDVPSFKLQPKPDVPTAMAREILINIETTDAKPWKGKIFSIAWLDLSMPEAEPQIIVDEDEEGILKEFIWMFEKEGFTKVWGFKTIFDYRFIFNKLMLYRMQSKAFYDAELGDVKQLLDQVKEAFVYFPDKTGKLDDYGKELLGIGKYGSQADLLRRYIAGDIPYVERFQLQQIQVTKGLFDLFRFSSSGASITPISNIPISETTPKPYQSSIAPQSNQTKKCPNCLADQPIGAEFCDICKTKL